MLAESFLKQEKIAYLSLDWIMMGFTRGLPQYGIHDKLMPDEIAIKLWRFLRPMLESMVWSGIDYVVEGEAVLPELIQEFVQENRGGVAVCFLGYTDIDIAKKLQQIRKFSLKEKDWLAKENDRYICEHIQNMVRYSSLIKRESEERGFRYFDTSVDILASVKEAKEYLMGESGP